MTAKLNKTKDGATLSLDMEEFLFIARVLGSTSPNKMIEAVERGFKVKIDNLDILYRTYYHLADFSKNNNIDLKEKL